MKNLNKLIGRTAMCLKPPKWPLWHQMGVVTFAYLGTWGWGHCKSVFYCGAAVPCATFILTYVLSGLPRLICGMICCLYIFFLNVFLWMREGGDWTEEVQARHHN